MTKPKRKWRSNLSPELGHNSKMSPDKAAVLTLHHIELALAHLTCLELEGSPEFAGVDEDILSEFLESEAAREELILHHLAERYGDGNGEMQAATRALMAAVRKHWEGIYREDAGLDPDNLAGA